MWGAPLSDFPSVFPADAKPYDTVIGADLLYNPSLYPFLLPTVLRLLGLIPEETGVELGSQKTVVYMCYMERGGEEAFFDGAREKGVVCDRPVLSADLAALAEELGCVLVRMSAPSVPAG